MNFNENELKVLKLLDSLENQCGDKNPHSIALHALIFTLSNNGSLDVDDFEKSIGKILKKLK